MKKNLLRLRSGSKGQSYMELAIVLSVLLILLVGMVEFSILLNQYVTLVDGAREGARFGSSGKVDPYNDPDNDDYTANPVFYEDIDCIIEGINGYCPAGTTGNGALDPIVLNPLTDDVIITFYRVHSGLIEATYGPWHRYGSGHSSRVSSSDVEASLDIAAPDSAVLVVEVFYDYKQLLKLPIFTNIIPDPIPVYTYAIMPLSRAKPTSIP